jgi:hypothetical protein
VQIHYQITEHDYVGAMRLGSRYFQRLALRIALISIPLILLLIWGPYYLRYAIFGGIGAALVISIVHYALLPSITRRHYQKYKALHNAQILAELTDEGIRFSHANGSSLTKWPHILKWQHNDRYLLLFLSPKIYQIIPKEQATPEAIEAFMQALNQHVGKAKH